MIAAAQRAKAIFLKAVEIASASERRAYLDAECGGDAALRGEIEALLGHYGQLGSFLESPLLEAPVRGDFLAAERLSATVDDPMTERPGTVIGPYKLLEQIGEGGMGLVFVAEQQQPVKRRVALKVIKPGMDSRQVIARFEAERQALALMDHPHIAKVYDGGTTAEGRPYFVMELVKGTPITAYCDQHRLTVRERLELFVDVCQAVQHAHQKGIIHRDLKPSNVLVSRHDTTPVVKVIDFGVAKALGQELTDKTLFTGIAQMIGTPLYMSPEQAGMSDLDIDTRSDIYSLGVLLYELMAGTTPFDKERLRTAGYDEIRRIIREEEPPKPSTRFSTLGKAATTVSTQRQSDPKQLSRLIRGELDWVVMKALEKDRNRRYETASAFAADVRRYLQDEPVQAFPPSAWYRFRKFGRRNRVPLTIATLTAAVMVLAVVGLALAFIAVDQERQNTLEGKNHTLAALDREEKQRQQAEENAERAQQNAKLAIGVLDEIVMKEARERIYLYGRQTSWDERNGEAENPERNRLEHAFFQKGLKFYEKLAETNATDWEARRERAKAYANIGMLQNTLNNHVQAEKSYGRAVDLLEELARERPGDLDNRFDLVESFFFSFSGGWKRYPFTRPPAEKSRHALELFEKLAFELSKMERYQKRLALDFTHLAFLLAQTGLSQEATRAYRVVVELNKSLVARFPQDTDLRNELAYCYLQLGETEKAEKEYRQKLTILNELAAKGGRPWYPLAAEHHRLAERFLKTQKLEEAAEELRQGIAFLERDLADNPKTSRSRHDLLRSCLRLAALLWDQGHYAEAKTAYRQVLANLERFVTGFPEGVMHRFGPGECQSRLAWFLVSCPDPEFRDSVRALPLAKEGVKLYQSGKGGGVRSFDEGFRWCTLGVAHYRVGEWKAAIAALNKANERGSWTISSQWFVLAMAYCRLGEMDKARTCFNYGNYWMNKYPALQYEDLQDVRRFRDEAQALLGVKEQKVLFGADHVDLRQWDKAAADYRKLLELEPTEPFLWFENACLRLQVGDREGYRKLCSQMVDGFGQSQDVDEIALLAHTCALAPQALGDPALVRKLAEQRMALTPHGSPHYIWSVHVLGLAYYHAGLPEKAIECLANGLEENPTWENNVLNWLVLAMAHKRLKHEEEALKWLDKARQWTEQKTPGAGKGAGFAPQGWHWRDWLGVQMLLREAEALLNR